MDRAGSGVVLELVPTFFSTSDLASPICGLVDLGRPWDTFAGGVFGMAWPGCAPLARYVERLNWALSGALKRDRLRGLYWGNYLGPRVLERLGGEESFHRLFTEEARKADGTPDAHYWRFDHGVFVSLCLDPIECRPNHPFGHVLVMHQAHWLIKELAVRGVLNQW